MCILTEIRRNLLLMNLHRLFCDDPSVEIARIILAADFLSALGFALVEQTILEK